jgi:hypothetical protein
MAMAALHTAPSRRPSRKSAVPPVTPTAGSGKSGIISEMASQTAKDRAVDPETRELMIAEAAYYCAEKRGFAPGHELEDWLEAEAQIEVVLRR